MLPARLPEPVPIPYFVVIVIRRSKVVLLLKSRFYRLLLCLPFLLTASCFVFPSSGDLIIGDQVWLDDGDGIPEEGEEGLPGIKVRLYEPDSEDPLRETTTYAEVKYNNVDDRQYFLEFKAPDECRSTLKDRGDDNNTDSDPDPNTNRTEVFPVREGDSQDHWDAGYGPLDVPLLTPTPTGKLVLHVPTVMITDTPQPSATPTPVNVICVKDKEDDVANCENHEPIDDLTADISEVEAEKDEVETRLVGLRLVYAPQNPAKTEYSYAAVVHVDPGQQALDYYSQAHNGQEDQIGGFRLGPTHPP